MTTSINVWIALAISSVPTFGLADDLGFRFNDGKCQNSNGDLGFNPEFTGECSDWSGKTLSNVKWTGSFKGSKFIGSIFESAVFDQVDFGHSSFASSSLNGIHSISSNWHSVFFEGASIVRSAFEGLNVFTDADFTFSEFKTTSITGAKFSNTLFWASSFSDVLVSQADFNTCDLNQVLFKNSSFLKSKFTGTNLKLRSFSQITFDEVEMDNTRFVSTSISPFVNNRLKMTHSNIKQSVFGISAEDALISDVHFQSVRFVGTNFHGGKLDEVSFSNCQLEKADFSATTGKDISIFETQADGISFSAANIDGLIISKSILLGFTATRASFPFSKIDQSTLNRSNFSDSDLGFSSVTNSELIGANFDRSKLQDLNFTKNNAPDSSWVSSFVQGTIFDNSDLSSARFSGCSGVRPSFKRISAEKASFSGCSISKSSFQYAYLPSANFRGADLSEAGFRLTTLNDAKLINADFSRADLKGASFVNTLASKTTKLPFTMDEAKSLGFVFGGGDLLLYLGPGVDYRIGDSGSEGFNLQKILSSTEGYFEFKDLKADDLSEKLDHSKTVIFPEFEGGAPAVTDLIRESLRQYVVNGGNIIFMYPPSFASFVKAVFDITITSSNVAGVSMSKEKTVCDLFAGFELLPDTVVGQDASNGILSTDLPSGSCVAYKSGNLAAVSAVPFGAGVIYLLGYDWFGSIPVGTEDGNWNKVLVNLL